MASNRKWFDMTEYCPSLPSSTDALRAVNGEPAGWALVVRDIFFRSGLIAAGVYMYNPKSKNIIKNSVAGSVAVEAFVLGWIWVMKPAAPQVR